MRLQGTYTDITEIGSGGGGTVFRAFHVRMQKYVVLKRIHANIRNSVDIQAEMNILKNLRHEYLPTVLDFIEEDGSIYTVMDYIAGESFESLLGKGVCFTQAQVAKYAAQLGRVLTYLHNQKPPIVHGDIKPANLMLTPEDNICLIDFNISQLQNGMVNQNMGYTPGFASPEQTRIVQALRMYYAGKGDTVLLDSKQNATPVLLEQMDRRSDIYSAGATLYAILSGRTPDADFSKVVPIETLVADCSEGLAWLIGKSMQLRPEERFQSAEKFSKAVADIAKMDKRYKHLILRQNLGAIFCILGMAGCSVLAILGRERMGAEQAASYNVLVQEMADLRGGDGYDEEHMEMLYHEAVSKFPEYADAYYQKAIFLYEKRDYEGLITFILEKPLDYAYGFSDEETADFYFLLANAYLEQDDIDNALIYYQTAIKNNPHDVKYYSDYAIALVRSGDLAEAEKVLAKAVENGLTNDKVLLAQGEIAARKGDIETAEKYFEQCIAETGDSYVTLRTYVIWGKLYDGDSSEEGLQKKISVLSRGLKAVQDTDRAVILEQLAQGYIDLGTVTDDNTYNAQAIDCLNEIVELGWDSYITHYNIGILYQMSCNYEAAAEKFSDMLELYGEDYRTYKRLAFLEIDIQEAKENRSRDYRQFTVYYEKAKQLFADSNNRADSDMEFKMLEQVYVQLEEGNWLNP